MEFDDQYSSSSSEDELFYLKPKLLSHRRNDSVPIIVVNSSNADEPAPSSNIPDEEFSEKEEEEERDEEDLDQEKIEENLNSEQNRDNAAVTSTVENLEKELTRENENKDREKIDGGNLIEEMEECLDSEKNESIISEDFLSFHSSEDEYLDNHRSDVIKQSSEDETEGEVAMKKDVACQTIVTGDIISLNLYHGSVIDGKMYGIITFEDIDKHLDLGQGLLSFV